MTCMCSKPIPNADRQIFFVLCDFGLHGLEWVAREPSNMDRASTIADIRSGELPDVVQVIELNPVEFSSRDVTEDILAECLKLNFVEVGERQFADQLAFERDHSRGYRNA